MNASTRLLITMGFIASGVALLAPQTSYAQDRSHAADVDRIIQQMSDPDLKTFYLRCSQGALQQVLSSSDLQLCSVGYEALLKRTFKGDFSALFAWSRGQPATTPTSARARGEM